MDLEIDRFFGELASLRFDLDEFEEWCEKYEKFRYEYPKWTTKGGTKISIYKMTNEHLANTIALLKLRDSNSTWLKVLNQEQTYRNLQKRIEEYRCKINQMEDVMSVVF